MVRIILLKTKMLMGFPRIMYVIIWTVIIYTRVTILVTFENVMKTWPNSANHPKIRRYIGLSNDPFITNILKLER